MVRLPHFSTVHRWFWPLLVLFLSLWIASANFQPGVWLTGWDTLHPEFDLGLNLQRTLSGAWREDQGLGAVAGHSHMSDLPRILILGLMSPFLPLESLIYVFILACLVIGPLGVYFFTLELLRKSKSTESKIWQPAAAAVGALWYLFNLGTVQHFFVVFEMFAVQYAALGWLFWISLKYWQTGKISSLRWLVIIGILSAPMAYASLLWFAAIGCLGLFLVTLTALETERLQRFFRSITIGITLIVCNAFWLLPNLYFILSGASTSVNQSHINRLFSPEAFLHNQAYGNLTDLALLKNFLFNWSEYRSNGLFMPLLEPWIKHLELPGVVLIGWLFFGLSLTGVAAALITKNKKTLALVPVLLVGVFMLINQNPPFTQLFIWLRAHSNLFEEGLRFPFTKFSLVYMLVMAGLLSATINVLGQGLAFFKLPRIWLQSIVDGIAILLIGLLIYFAWPMTQGHLLSEKMRNQIPQPYFELMTWAKTQPTQTRFALLPLETYAGWHYLNWNYEGPGFLWFGFPQPLLVRDFDRWEPSNEDFYDQLSTAIYGNNRADMYQTLTKYRVKYIIVDNSTLAPGKEPTYLKLDDIPTLLTDLGAKLVWHQNFLSVYELPTAQPGFLHTPPSYVYSSQQATSDRTDPAFATYGSYIETNQTTDSTNLIEFPLASLVKSTPVNAKYESELVEFVVPLRPRAIASQLVLPGLTKNQTYTTLVNIVREADALKLTFGPQTNLIIGSQKSSLPQLPTTIVPLAQSFGSQPLEVEFNGSKHTISASQSAQFVTALIPEEPISLSVSNASTSGQLTKNERFSLPTESWNDLTRGLIATVPAQTNQLTVQVITQPTVVDIRAPLTGNCQPQQHGTVQAQKTTLDVTYEAESQGIACTGLVLPAVTTSQDFLLRFIGNNTLGRSIKWYLNNKSSDHLDFEELLPSNQFDVTYSVIGWPQLTTNTYWLNWETRSFGQPSQNHLRQLELYPLPLQQLTNLTIQPLITQSISNSASQLSGKKSGSHLYQSHVRVTGPNGLLVLDQAYNTGWLSFIWPTDRSPWQQYQQPEHVKYNSWANAWILPQGEWNVLILYWPQLLSFTGFGLLLLTIGWLCLSRWFDK